MRNRLLPLIRTLALIPTFAFAQTPFQEPPVRENVDVNHRVALPASAPAPCVAVVFDEVEVLIDAKRLADAAGRADSGWTPEAERLELINSDRAAAIIKALSGVPHDLGCRVFQVREHGPDALYFVLNEVKAGKVSARATATQQWLHHLNLGYSGRVCGPACGRGNILLHAPGFDRPFMLLSWWVS
jgi:hypothetical protein